MRAERTALCGSFFVGWFGVATSHIWYIGCGMIQTEKEE